MAYFQGFIPVFKNINMRLKARRNRQYRKLTFKNRILCILACIILILIHIKVTMCGTFTQLLGQAVAIGVIDSVLTPSFYASSMGVWIDVILKGIATFWVYKYAQCTSGTRSPNTQPFQNYNAMQILVGGLIGALTLYAVGQVVGENAFGKDKFVTYLVDAIAVHLVYGVSHSIIMGFSA